MLPFLERLGASALPAATFVAGILGVALLIDAHEGLGIAVVFGCFALRIINVRCSAIFEDNFRR